MRKRLSKRVKCDRDAVNSHLVSVCVRVFLEKRETLLSRFCEEFKKLSLPDEKLELVENFLGKIHSEMENDSIWQGIFEFYNYSAFSHTFNILNSNNY